MKKEYTEPVIEWRSFNLAVDVLFHSPFEGGGTNDDWDWNDDEDDLTPQQRFAGDLDGLY